MKLVINICKDDFEEICMQARMVEDTGSLFGRIRKAISHCTPLPKGHGNLIDVSELTPDADYEDGIFGAVSCQQIVEAEAIIKADEEENEETETWNGIHAQITAPKGTFERIFNDADDDNDI